jgi:hypothetical protein
MVKKKDKQRSTKHTHQTKDQATRIPLKTGGKLKCSVRVSSSCFNSGSRRVNMNLATYIQCNIHVFAFQTFIT